MELFSDRYYDSERKPAFQLLGKTFTQKLTASEAVQEAKLDYEVHTHPLYARLGEELVDTPAFGIFRDPTPDSPEYVYFGKVTKRYDVLQNTEIAELIDPISEKWPVNTAGSLNLGKRLFIALDAGDMTIKNDPIHQYFMVTDWKGGGCSLKIMVTPVRLWCGNQLSMALRKSIVTINLSHGRKPREKFIAIKNAIQDMQESSDSTFKALEFLTKKKMNLENVKEFVKVLYPLPNMDLYDPASTPIDKLNSVKYQFEKVQTIHESIISMWQEFNDKVPQVANTGYVFYNNVVEMEDYRTGRNPLADSLFGWRKNTKEKAFELVATRL